MSYAEEGEEDSAVSSDPPSKRRMGASEPSLRKHPAVETRRSTRIRISTLAVSASNSEESEDDDDDESDYSSSAGEEELAQMDMQLDQED